MRFYWQQSNEIKLTLRRDEQANSQIQRLCYYYHHHQHHDDVNSFGVERFLVVKQANEPAFKVDFV